MPARDIHTSNNQRKPESTPRATEHPLPSWNDGETRRTLMAFVESVTRPGDRYVPPEDRIAVFDNDGTLWCEKPMPVELGFILERLAEMAHADPALRERQPWKAAFPLNRDDDYRMFEYACHEDNSAIRNFIEASRFERRTQP